MSEGITTGKKKNKRKGKWAKSIIGENKRKKISKDESSEKIKNIKINTNNRKFKNKK